MDVHFKQLPPPMALALSASFGSPALWHEDFAWRAASEPLALCFDASHGRLFNRPPAESDGEVVLHRSDEPLDWPRVYERYQQAVHDASDDAGVPADALGDAVLLDVRRAGVFEQAATMLPGATWHDPARVADWARELPQEKDVVVYCVYGHEVGRATALRLRAHGVRARYLIGGIDGWQAAGRTVAPRGEQP
ncbi:MAG TPA: rhodanese-like domain-containing protein [Burkholderiaceae bacterium]|jgi:Fe-Mn family superoxide dismutase|nr:rhodanese-like domain-containing protein [Burkholderiaceae bacterium]